MVALRQALLFFTVAGLIQSPFAGIARAEAAPTKLAQEIDDVFELLPPARKGETIAELYDRLSPRISPEFRVQFVDYLADIHKKEAPMIKVEGRTATFTEGKNNKAVLKIEESKDQVKILLNGQLIREKDGKSVKAIHDRVVQILKSEAKDKKALLWSMIVPSAQAFDWGSGGIGALVGAIATYFIMTKFLNYQKVDPAAAVNYTCSYGQNECCIVNSAYVAGCCNQYAASTPGVQRAGWLSAANCVSPVTTSAAGTTTTAPGVGTPVFKSSGKQ